jgi:hypothetical protein
MPVLFFIVLSDFFPVENVAASMYNIATAIVHRGSGAPNFFGGIVN